MPKKQLIKVDYSQSLLEMMIVAGIPSWMRKDIEKIVGPLHDFKFTHKGIQTFEVEDVCFAESIKGKAVSKKIKAEHEGWHAHDIEHLLAYAIAHPKKFCEGLFFAANTLYKNHIFMMHRNRQSLEIELLEDHPWSHLSRFPKYRLILEG